MAAHTTGYCAVKTYIWQFPSACPDCVGTEWVSTLKEGGYGLIVEAIDAPSANGFIARRK